MAQAWCSGDLVGGGEADLPRRGSDMGRARSPRGADGPEGGREVPSRGGGDALRPVRVVHVVLSMELGGLERVVIDLVREGQALGQHVEVICLESGGVLAPLVESLDAPIIVLDKSPGFRPDVIRRMDRLFHKLRPDVIHTHQMGALLYSSLSQWRGGEQLLVHTEHGRHYPGRLKTRVLSRLATSSTARFYCVSRDIADSIVAHRIAAVGKVRVVPNGIETARFTGRGGEDPDILRRRLGVPPGVAVIGTIGRLDEIKRQDLLIRSFAELKRSVPDTHLLIVGQGPRMNELRETVARLGLEASVSLVGFQPEPESYLRVMDVFALTSRSEGMPLVILEAWASGVPVVASRVGGIPELIESGVNGLLFEPDDEAGLADSLRRLLSDPLEARRIAEAGRSLARIRYDVRAMAATYHRDYCVLLGRGEPG
jgi:glycosyltransferase involved in cell wall biosynthesis